MKKIKQTFLRLAKDSLIVTFGGLMWAASFAALNNTTEGSGFNGMVPGGIILAGVFSVISFVCIILYKIWR